ncbi:MAG: nucleotide exchange factor GrpE [Bacteroidetes bacterium]|nr:MAG: nucleotide exchange factor GrpE [Bacteroidota bacterium]
MTKKSEETKAAASQEEKVVDNAATEVVENEETNVEASEGDNASDEIGKLKSEIEELKNQNLRLYAEFENFRKRNARERVELSTTANREVLNAMLPVLDDFQRALKNISEAEADSESSKGITLIYNKLNDTLKQKGLKPMENTVGKKFDVDFMEAITKIPAPTPDMAGKVIDEIEPGYYIGEKILRYAKVVVADGEPQS